MKIEDVDAACGARKLGEPAWIRGSLWDDRVSGRVRDILGKATDAVEARVLAYDWELLVNEEPEIVRQAAIAWKDCANRCWSGRERAEIMARLGEAVLSIVIRKARRVAEAQLEMED